MLQAYKECWVCGYEGDALHRHHIYGGKGRRDLSERYGLVVWLCYRHHNGSNEGVHFNHTLDLKLKQEGQRYYEQTIGTREQFRSAFNKSYL